ncbi:MAG: 2-oxoadipate dioxygenase/decarboxylase family protein, partial [Chitinophagaceae bacterium]
LNDPHIVGAFLHQSLWRIPTLSDYLQLLNESEYAAWVIYNRYYLNHYTISVHYLKDGFNQLTQFNAFLEKNGIKLNDAGGKIKVSPDGLLLQSSTVAQVLEANFANEEKHHIAGSYVEFAERRVLPEFAHLPEHERKRKHLREGFEANNADKIFESTFTTQINRK